MDHRRLRLDLVDHDFRVGLTMALTAAIVGLRFVLEDYAVQMTAMQRLQQRRDKLGILIR